MPPKSSRGKLPFQRTAFCNGLNIRCGRPYVPSDEITVEELDETTQHFAAGRVIPEPVKTVDRGVEGDEEATFIMFYAGVKKMPLAKGK